jgi:hypothetical protein
MLGMIATAVVMRHVSESAAWHVSVPLLIAGFGGGMLTSPNLTLTLQQVPVSMAGAAGGAVQAAQRIGSAIGSAVLVSVFYSQLSRGGYAYQTAISNTLLCAAGVMLLALSLAITDLMRRPRRSGRLRRPSVQ